MIDPLEIKEALCRAVLATTAEGGVKVTTHCLYPSNGTVAVTVRHGIDGFIVTDDGGATSEAWAAGLIEHATDKQARNLMKPYGLKVKDGAIYSPTISAEEIPAAIILVANAAKDLANWSLTHLRYGEKRNFKSELAALLQRHFRDNIKQVPIIGMSNRQYNFDHVIYLSRGRKLLVDGVTNDPTSINSRVVANLDVQMNRDDDTKQLIVYDDLVQWSSSDLKVLEVGARTVPFSLAEREIEQLAA